MDSIQLALYYRRADAVARLFDETKVWSYWSFQERMIEAVAIGPVTLNVLRGVLRERAEIVRRAAALPPGTRIVVRQGDGDVMLVATGPERDRVRWRWTRCWRPRWALRRTRR